MTKLRLNFFTSKPRTAIGVDIGGRMIKAVQLVRAGRDRWRLAAALTLAQPDANMPVVPQTARYLREALFRHGFIGDDIVLAAAPKQVDFDVLELPPRSSGAPVEQIARVELARNAKLGSEPFELNCWDLPAPSRAGSATSVMAVAMRHAQADALLDPFEAEGFTVRAIDVPCCALARAARQDSSADAITAVLDIGWNAGQMCLVLDGIVIFQRSIGEAGLGILTRAMGEEFDLAEDEADYVLGNVGLRGSGPEVVDPALARRVGELISRYADSTIEEIGAAFQYASHRYAHAPVKQLLLAGGGSAIAGLPQFLAPRLGVEVNVLSPSRIVDCPPSLAARCDDGTLTVALGLALHGQV